MTAAPAWLVTGASSGFGRAIVKEAVDRGAYVAAAARSISAISDLVAAAPGKVLPLQLDVTDPDQINAATKEAYRHFGNIDVLVNNAGHGMIAAVEEASDVAMRELLETNFFGLARMTKAVLPTMRRQRRGTIVNISSVAGATGAVGCAFYCASKFAVEGFSEALAQEIAPFGLKVLIVEPGAFRTDFFGRSMAWPERPMDAYRHVEDLRQMLRKQDGRQAGDPARGARAIAEALAMDDMPLRLVLGRVAFERTREALLERMTDIERTRKLAANADFPRQEKILT